MLPPNIFYSALLFIAGIACLFVAALVWSQRRSASGARAFIGFMLALAWWDLTYALFWADAPAPNPYFWLDVTYLGVVAVPPAFLAFTLHFANLRHWLTRPAIFGLVAQPILVLIFLATDPLHNLFFAGNRALNSTMILEAGPIFWANVIYSYILLIIACAVLARQVLRTTGIYRRQAALLLGAALIPWFNSIIFVFGYSPLPNADNTPFAFSTTAVIMAFALLRYRLLDVVPIARDVLIENMDDGVIVLDSQDRIVDINLAAQKIIGHPLATILGQPADKVLDQWPDLVDKFRSVAQAKIEIKAGSSLERFLDVQISPLMDRRKQFVGRLIVWRDITDLKLSQAEFQKLATMDALTQIYNRRYFLELAEKELQRAIRLNHSLALVLVDIDHFKRVNDAYGHPVGDYVLHKFAEICHQNIRGFDLYARFGGEEFIFLMPETSVEQALQVTERLCRMVAETRFEVDDAQISITGSFGLTVLANANDTIDRMVSRADKALYAAKQAGRNRVMVWDEAFAQLP